MALYTIEYTIGNRDNALIFAEALQKKLARKKPTEINDLFHDDDAAGVWYPWVKRVITQLVNASVIDNNNMILLVGVPESSSVMTAPMQNKNLTKIEEISLTSYRDLLTIKDDIVQLSLVIFKQRSNDCTDFVRWCDSHIQKPKKELVLILGHFDGYVRGKVQMELSQLSVISRTDILMALGGYSIGDAKERNVLNGTSSAALTTKFTDELNNCNAFKSLENINFMRMTETGKIDDIKKFVSSKELLSHLKGYFPAVNTNDITDKPKYVLTAITAHAFNLNALKYRDYLPSE